MSKQDNREGTPNDNPAQSDKAEFKLEYAEGCAWLCARQKGEWVKVCGLTDSCVRLHLSIEEAGSLPGLKFDPPHNMWHSF